MSLSDLDDDQIDDSEAYRESGEDFDDTENDENDDDAYMHIGYYVRRGGGELFLVQTFLMQSEENGEIQNDIRTVYVSFEQLEPEWAEAVALQGADLPDGKSREFIPPEEDTDYLDFVDLDELEDPDEMSDDWDDD